MFGFFIGFGNGFKNGNYSGFGNENIYSISSKLLKIQPAPNNATLEKYDFLSEE